VHSISHTVIVTLLLDVLPAVTAWLGILNVCTFRCKHVWHMCLRLSSVMFLKRLSLLNERRYTYSARLTSTACSRISCSGSDFYVWVSVHHKSILYKEPTRCIFGSIVY
jgi:hypothetical protein